MLAVANPDIAEVMRLASLLPIVIHSLLHLIPQSRLTRDRSTPSGIPSHVRTLVSPAAILSRDSTQVILLYLRSSRITTRSLDLLGNPRTFLPWFWSLLGSLWIFLRSSLDLSDSSLILEIGPSSEILHISRPFATFPLPFPLTLRLPLPGRLEGFLLLAVLLITHPLSLMIALFRFWL